MKPISPRYERILNKYYFSKARRRFSAVYCYSAAFLEIFPLRDQVQAGIDVVKLENFIKSYFLDVIKFKEYHFSAILAVDDIDEFERIIHSEKLLNRSKVGAFTAKWLLKNHPVYIVPRDGVFLSDADRQIIALAPYILIAGVTLALMGFQTQSVPQDSYRKLIYHMRFRNIDDRGLILYFDALCKLMDELRKKEPQL